MNRPTFFAFLGGGVAVLGFILAYAVTQVGTPPAHLVIHKSGAPVKAITDRAPVAAKSSVHNIHGKD